MRDRALGVLVLLCGAAACVFAVVVPARYAAGALLAGCAGATLIGVGVGLVGRRWRR